MHKGIFKKEPSNRWGAYLIVALLGLLAAPKVHSQSRAVNGLGLAPGLQAEYAMPGDDYVFIGTTSPLTTGGLEGLNLNRAGLQAGFERFWNPRWSGGATLHVSAYRVVRDGSASSTYVDLAPELFVRHWNTLGSFNFRQRLGVEYLIPGGEGNESRAVTRLRLDLDRLIPVGGSVVLRPRLAYEGFAYLRLQRDEDEPRERTIDFTALRAEVGVRLSDHFDFMPWFAYQTAYSIGLQQTDINGNVVIPGGRRNIVTPVVGLDLRYTFFKGKQVFERRQLPTPH